MVFDSSVKFYGTYRPYQQRVLDNLVAFLDNEKIHVVAAPGSGKTILGLELIIRLDKPSLILTPSIAIREQWIDRFSKGFLKNEEDKGLWISNSLNNIKPIICITYQAFYSAFKKEKLLEEDEENISTEETDFSDFELFDTLLSNNIKTICLDECHHLKSEWWKVLEYTIKKIKDVSLIALTATPPYDSSYVEWQRYINLCGPIDEEIFVPELIKDKNLCPHQDYLYFSYPTKEEERKILKSYSNGIKTFYKYKNNSKLVEIICSNNIFKDYEKMKKAIYGNEEYYESLICFLLENKVKVPFKVKHLISNKKLTLKHFEILLQYLLFEDMLSYKKDDMILSMKKEFSALGIVHNRKISLVHDERLNKVFALSLSKLDSIETIVRSEISSFKENLKCLILSDYIKLKSKSYIGNDKPIDSFGTIPIFEHLRRKNISDVKLCCLSGAICIIPVECKEYLSEFEFSKLADDNYVEVIVNTTNRKKIVAKITKLLENGHINVLIGTKALLGEGWDSPCVNSLIMASFIGSYVLSNQMRGRAIRTNKDDLNKISNVWHLVCLNPYDYAFSYDYYNLQKRFSTFVGINLEKKCIENGIERLGFSRIPYNFTEASLANEKTLLLSKDSNNVKKTWEECIENASQIETLTKVTTIPRRRLKKEISFYFSFIVVLLSLFVGWVNQLLYIKLLETNIHKLWASVICVLIFILNSVIFIQNIFKTFRLINPEMKLYTLGNSVLKALIKKGSITSKKIKIKVYREGLFHSSIYLLNATTYEQNTFSDCIVELLGQVNQPRYLFSKPKGLMHFEYYVVPDAFKKNKETVNYLFKPLKARIGSLAIIFAKNIQGRSEVLRAHKLYYLKYKKVEIITKNVLMPLKRKRKK